MDHLEMHRNQGDRGQALGLIVIAVTLIICSMVAIVDVSARLVERSRAQTAADSAALAGVDGGRAAANAVAAANGGHIVSFARHVADDGTDVAVTVAVGDESGSARASSRP